MVGEGWVAGGARCLEIVKQTRHGRAASFTFCGWNPQCLKVASGYFRDSKQKPFNFCDFNPQCLQAAAGYYLRDSKLKTFQLLRLDSFVFSNCCRLLDGFNSKIFQLVRFDSLVCKGCSRLLEGLKLQYLSTFAVRPLSV